MEYKTIKELLVELEQKVAFEILNTLFNKEFRSTIIVDPDTGKPVECIVKSDIEDAFDEIRNKYGIEVTIKDEEV